MGQIRGTSRTSVICLVKSINFSGHPFHQLRRLIDQSINSGLFELLVAFSLLSLDSHGRRPNICVTLANNLMTHYDADAQAGGLKAKYGAPACSAIGLPEISAAATKLLTAIQFSAQKRHRAPLRTFATALMQKSEPGGLRRHLGARWPGRWHVEANDGATSAM